MLTFDDVKGSRDAVCLVKCDWVSGFEGGMVFGPCVEEILDVAGDDDLADSFSGCFAPFVVDVLDLARSGFAVERCESLCRCEL